MDKPPLIDLSPLLDDQAIGLEARSVSDDHLSLRLWLRLLTCTTMVERGIRRRLRELVMRLDVISMRPHSYYVLVGRRTALNRDFETMLDDLRSALGRLERQPKDQVARPPKIPARAPGREAGTGSRQDTASNNKDSRASRKPN